MLFVAAVLAQFLFTLLLGGSPFARSGPGLALYHSLSVPAYALICVGLAGYYARYKDRMGRVEEIAYFVFFISAFVVAIAASISAVSGWLAYGTAAGVLESVHETTLPAAIGSLFFGSMLRGLSSIARDGAPSAPIVMVISAPLAIVALSGIGVGAWLLLAPKLLLGTGWAWLGRQTDP
jgi:hypothetical protein